MRPARPPKCAHSQSNSHVRIDYFCIVTNSLLVLAPPLAQQMLRWTWQNVWAIQELLHPLQEECVCGQWHTNAAHAARDAAAASARCGAPPPCRGCMRISPERSTAKSDVHLRCS